MCPVPGSPDDLGAAVGLEKGRLPVPPARTLTSCLYPSDSTFGVSLTFPYSWWLLLTSRHPSPIP